MFKYTAILLEKLLLGSKWSNIFRRIPVRRWVVYILFLSVSLSLSLSWRSTLFTRALSRGLCNSSTVQLQLSKAHRQLSVKLSGASEQISKYTRSFLECLLTHTWARTTHARSQDRLVLSPPRQHYPDYSIYSSPVPSWARFTCLLWKPTLPIIYPVTFRRNSQLLTYFSYLLHSTLQ